MFFNIFLKNSSIELIILMLGMRNCYANAKTFDLNTDVAVYWKRNICMLINGFIVLQIHTFRRINDETFIFTCACSN